MLMVRTIFASVQCTKEGSTPVDGAYDAMVDFVMAFETRINVNNWWDAIDGIAG